jgi:hypothetical protein
MKRLRILAIILVSAFLFAACQREGETSMSGEISMTKELVEDFIADDSKALSELLTREYALQELKSFFGKVFTNETLVLGEENDAKYLTINTVHQKYPIECLRTNGYSVYKVREGGYFYVFWCYSLGSDPSPEGGAVQGTPEDAIVCFAAHIASLKKASDFDSIKEGISTAADVARVDPAFELVFLLSSRTPSYSLLEDGTMMEICYKWEGALNTRSDLIVKSKEVLSKDDSASKLAGILPTDLP